MVRLLFGVMPGLVPGIHVFFRRRDVDGRDKPGHEESEIRVLEKAPC